MCAMTKWRRRCTAAFFTSTRGTRLLQGGLYYGFNQACVLAGLKKHAGKLCDLTTFDIDSPVNHLAECHRQKLDVQTMLPLVGSYLGHARYRDPAYDIATTSELLGLASARAFENRRCQQALRGLRSSSILKSG